MDNKLGPSGLVELLRSRAIRHPERRVFTFLADEDSEEVHMRYGELDRQARALGGFLQGMGLSGKRVLFLYPPGLEILSVTWACIYGGMVTVYAYPPDPARLAETLPQFLAIAKDSEASVVLTTSSILSMMDPLFQLAPQLKTLQWICSDTISGDSEKNWEPPCRSPEDTIFLQYTSGSTGNPKGVLFSERNIFYQLVSACQVTKLSPESVIVSWIPLYHNLGIGIVMQAIMAGSALILMSPLTFLQRPQSWLQAISHYKATHSLGPNFAYELCAQQIKAEEKAGLDLSSWETAICGAEKIRADTVDRFVTAFSPCGFRREAFTPGYGLTEATLMVSCQLKGAPLVIKGFQKEALEKNRVIEVPPGEEGSHKVMGCGRLLPDQKMLIVHPDSLTLCQDDEVGEIWISSPSVAQGYWNLPNETDQTFKAHLPETGEGPFLRTGDMGFLREGELFVTGRLKEIIIIRGRNHYPQDIEQTVQGSHPLLRAGCGAAFSIDIEHEEKLFIVQELESSEKLDLNAMVGSIRMAVSKFYGIHLHAVVFVKPDSIPKTRNGKIQRYLCRKRFLEGTLEVVGSSLLNDSRSRAYLPPRNSTEEILTKIFSQVLGLQQVGVNDNFFEWGGNSLLATQLLSRTREIFQVEIPLSSFFELSTVASLAELLVKHEAAAGQIAVMGRLRKDIDQMSPEEIRRLLREKKKNVGAK